MNIFVDGSDVIVEGREYSFNTSTAAQRAVEKLSGSAPSIVSDVYFDGFDSQQYAQILTDNGLPNASS